MRGWIYTYHDENQAGGEEDSQLVFKDEKKLKAQVLSVLKDLSKDTRDNVDGWDDDDSKDEVIEILDDLDKAIKAKDMWKALGFWQEYADGYTPDETVNVEETTIS